MLRQRRPPFRSRALLDMCEGEDCVRCGRRNGTTVGAHYTGFRRDAYQGGMSIKVHDFCVADLCGECHEWMDRLSRNKNASEEHSELFQHYILLTLEKRFRAGMITVHHISEATVTHE